VSTRADAAPARSAPRFRPTGRAVILGLLVIALLLAAIYPIRTYFEQRARVAEMEQQAATLEQANGRLEARIAQLNDPAFLERWARECLGMVKPGEKPFVIVPEEGDPEPLDC
jgi:cell division protein FtsB